MTLAITRIRESSSRDHNEFSESALAALWQKAHALTDGLVTEDGRRLRVLYPGRQNPRAGPDFHNAVLSNEDGELLTGDIELHINAPDWYAHRHHVDANYNGVILHVVLHTKGNVYTTPKSRLSVPIASLETEPRLYSEREDCQVLEYLQSQDEASIFKLLEAKGAQRFYAKSRGFALEIQNEEVEQILYRGLMEALGYASNRRPFRRLAEIVPISSLSVLKNEPSNTRLIAIRAMLLAGSGLLPRLKPSEEAEEARRILRHPPRFRAVSSDEWTLFRIRPANHPIARIKGAASLIDRYIDDGLVSGVESVITEGDGEGLIHALTVKPFIGASRAGDIAINVVLPFLHAYAEIKKSDHLKNRAAEICQMFPKLQDNEITREMRRLLPGFAAVKVKTAQQQQGLIQLYKEMTRPTSVTP